MNRGCVLDHIPRWIGYAKRQLHDSRKVDTLFRVVVGLDYILGAILLDGVHLVAKIVGLLLCGRYSVIGGGNDLFFLVLGLGIGKVLLGRGQVFLGSIIVIARFEPQFAFYFMRTGAVLRRKGLQARILYIAMLQDLAHQEKSRRHRIRTFFGLADDLDR